MAPATIPPRKASIQTIQAGDIFYSVNGERVYLYSDVSLLMSQKAYIPRHVEDDGKIQGAEDADGVLSGSTDVEQTCSKSYGNGKSRHYQRSSSEEHVAHVDRVEAKSKCSRFSSRAEKSEEYQLNALKYSVGGYAFFCKSYYDYDKSSDHHADEDGNNR